MDQVIHTLMFILRNKREISLSELTLKSLADSSPGAFVVIYNLGVLSNRELERKLSRYDLRFKILGKGRKNKLSQAKMACFNYIWVNYPQAEYISEIDLGMIFSNQWVDKLINFLEENKEEPLVSPKVLTSAGELYPQGDKQDLIDNVPQNNLIRMKELLVTLEDEGVREGVSLPIMHRSDMLQDIGGYDTRFFKAKEGYEEESILLAYRYYLGLRNNWKPKSYNGVVVYNDNFQKSLNLVDDEEINQNLQGLICQYGIRGLLELKQIYSDDKFKELAETALLHYK